MMDESSALASSCDKRAERWLPPTSERVSKAAESLSAFLDTAKASDAERYGRVRERDAEMNALADTLRAERAAREADIIARVDARRKELAQAAAPAALPSQEPS